MPACSSTRCARTTPTGPCWGFGPPPRTVRFWLRRQAHETALHRWDVEHALTGHASLDEPLALDGLDEVAIMFVPRQLRLGRLEPDGSLLALHPDGADAPVLLDLGAEPGQAPPAVVRGSAETLLLLVWGRVGLDDRRLSVSGDRGSAERVLAGPLVP